MFSSEIRQKVKSAIEQWAVCSPHPICWIKVFSGRMKSTGIDIGVLYQSDAIFTCPDQQKSESDLSAKIGIPVHLICIQHDNVELRAEIQSNYIELYNSGLIPFEDGAEKLLELEA